MSESTITQFLQLSPPTGTCSDNGTVDFAEAEEGKKSAAERETLTSINDDLKRGAGPRRFFYKDLASATSNFLENKMLGEGGFGSVYKGYLIDLDMAVAVKKVSRGSKQEKKEYVTEVKTISQLRHRNLVQLLGCCHDRGEFLLVYEFMPNGSLDGRLFGKKSPLAWAVRLMDHELGPKTIMLVGTLAYMASEYISTCRVSQELDVFSFRVVALEIATRRKVVNRYKEFEMGLVAWVWDLYGERKLLSAANERMDSRFDEQQMTCLLIVGLWCAHPDRCFRPSIRQAIQVLNFETTMPNLPSKMHVPSYHVPTPSVSYGEPFITNSSFEVGR
ncbi:hypothetical protein WN943_021676 [Citrus x changshan-huyou]